MQPQNHQAGSSTLPTSKTTINNTDRIRELNDRFRSDPTQWFNGSGRLVWTRGINALPSDDVCEVMRQVRIFSAFSADNDPHGEHDFGAFQHKGQRIFWKIDTYDRCEETFSPDPADPAVAMRVLTVMLAEER